MADKIFEDPRLVAIYDSFDGERNDLFHYLNLINELKVKSILDIGSGTGCFAELLVKNNFQVYGLEPAAESLKLAKEKVYSGVEWIPGDATEIPSHIKADLAIMTGNVAQVFLTDDEWSDVLQGVKRALNPRGYFVFEVRDPANQAWLDWSKEKTFQQKHIPQIGKISAYCEVLSTEKDLVSFRWTYHFEEEDFQITSDSTLRFREKKDIITSLEENGFVIQEVRGAPDRPGKEFVFITQVATAAKPHLPK